MPTLVNYGGEDGGLYSISSHVDLYCPARKRARISPGPFSFAGSFFEQSQSPSMEDVLPDECLFEILRRVLDGRDRISSACVSKRWLGLMSSIKRTEMPSEAEPEEGGCLTRALEGKKATDLRLAAISIGTGGRGGLGKLSIRSAQVTDLGLSAISRGCSSLKTLSLWNVPSVGDEGVIEIASGCPLLERLDLAHCPSISNQGLIAIAEGCPNLTALSLESCSRIGNEGLQAVAGFCSKLQSLSIRDCPLVGDHGVSSLVSSAGSLSKVKLQSLNITDFSIAVIGHYGKAITSLTLSGLPNASEKGFWVMGNARGLQKLVSLTISSCRGVTDLSLEAIGKVSSASLKQVCLKKCSFVSDEGLLGFARGAAGSLESLQIEECHRITQTGIVGALSSGPAKLKSLTLVKCLGVKDVAAGDSFPEIPCQSLWSLSVRSCPGFGNRSLAAVGKMCPNLQNVDLSGLYGITDAGIISLLSLTGCLVSMNLSGCLNLTDEAVVSLVKLHGSTLESLNLDGCRKITDASLRAIAGDCFSLGDLDLSKCSVTDTGILALSSSGRINLQVLSLSGCSEVSNKSAAALEKLGKTLIGLNLQHCNAIHISTVEMLVESLWRCDILF